ncbi:nicotinate-nucleotide pyrophosphorylase [candidate division TA06 bacterium DG_24]|uniref:Probable nicotinate-nucleotide pyrophosphorylase [carboxylating] n=3 Tax=Bacteria division TA06 TaxID=1156500 RepID=A0A0S8JPA9_UNCT6|nr:MAG: nicotinate-nucleotide pyrophosphorylase [candidate division TA06 bacterium DG_24]KPK70873.1 MAG: nicotinate-nucleotide pyrophosphorylase [candidate division TA06 bacterium SM23_40]KPL11588.1 MAG: nicotinate-nucleotide pyrophosphorylase [candidate division TA06 bacterium SM1_40]
MSFEPDVDEVVDAALAEDLGDGDITCRLVVPADSRAEGLVVAKAHGVVAGLEVAKATFLKMDPEAVVVLEARDGDRVEPGQVLARVQGRAAPILSAERTALNFVMLLSGIATLTAEFVERIEGTGAVILDTRKTAPGLRMLQKYAVRMGGGSNHRMGLFDMVLVKDNHIRMAGGVRQAVERAAGTEARPLVIEVEVTDLSEVEEALAAGADRLLLDNMDIGTMKRAVDLARGRAEVEASGGVTLDTVREIALTGVDYISVGALTHSAPALDVSLEVDLG